MTTVSSFWPVWIRILPLPANFSFALRSWKTRMTNTYCLSSLLFSTHRVIVESTWPRSEATGSVSIRKIWPSTGRRTGQFGRIPEIDYSLDNLSTKFIIRQLVFINRLKSSVDRQLRNQILFFMLWLKLVKLLLSEFWKRNTWQKLVCRLLCQHLSGHVMI